MILFVPAYDEPTQSNLAIAGRMSEGSSDRRLFAEGATEATLRAAIVRTLGDLSSSLFAMSHGTRDELRGQGGAAALTCASHMVFGLLAPRSAFIFACHTATVLGRAASRHGVIWWGYTGAIQSPVSDEPFAELFVGIFDFLRREFARPASAEERRRILDELRRRCSEAEGRVDELYLADPTLDPSEAFLCLLHLWDRLRIWVPAQDTPECHPNARPPSLM